LGIALDRPFLQSFSLIVWGIAGNGNCDSLQSDLEAKKCAAAGGGKIKIAQNFGVQETPFRNSFAVTLVTFSACFTILGATFR
jgi:hypothetical protein